jgi:hypothetical protein
MSSTREKLKAEIVLCLKRQGIENPPEKALYILRYLDEGGQVIEEPDWIELEGWEPTSLEWPAPQNRMDVPWHGLNS